MKLTDHLYYYREFGGLDCNTYLVKGEKLLIIDPGSEATFNKLEKGLNSDGIKLDDVDIIANTHLHLDHCMADTKMRSKTNAHLALHNLQIEHKETSLKMVSGFFGADAPEITEDDIELVSPLDLGMIQLEIIPTPGHSPDSICFYCREEGFVICGDLIFSRSTGRVDLPGGDRDQLKDSIDEIRKLYLDELLPGHLGIIRGREEIQQNFDYIQRYVLDMM